LHRAPAACAMPPFPTRRSSDLGWALGFRTFVLQGGEGLPAEQACALMRAIKGEFPGCAVTLSLGEYPTEDYRAMKAAGADRYLRSEEHTSELQSRFDLVCRLLL